MFGTRMAGGTSALKGVMPLYKFIGNKILTAVQNRILKSNFSEFHSGYRSYSTALLRSIPFEVNSNDFHFDTEIIIQCLAVKAKIVEIPIPTFYGDEVCHVNGMQYARNVVLASLRFSLGQMGFLYDRKYDLKNQHYPRTDSPYSAHQRIVDKVPAFSRTLVIGCTSATMIQRLVAKGCVVDGIDSMPREEVPAALHTYHRINLATELERLAEILKNNNYDYILLADVLERMVEPERLLDFIRTENAPRPRPTVIASTSNVAFIVLRAMLALGQFNYGVRGILDRHHTRLFTKKSFERIFVQSGFDVEEISGVSLPLSTVFGDSSGLAMKLEAATDFLARTWPGSTAYQLIISAKPLPTTNQLLEVSQDHSEDLRNHEQAEVDEDETETADAPVVH
ncbi:MAG: methyltransferase domain-containing protein [Deltaproteobacteria bacterium]|nr:methyltransferase domain-containing protein [Deltaproteobacteria bacterium]